MILLTKHWEWKILPLLAIIKIGHGLVGKGQVTQKAKQWGETNDNNRPAVKT